MADLGDAYTQKWDPALIVLSFIVATLGAYPAVVLMSSIERFSRMMSPKVIISLSAMSLSCVGIWSMHFVGMRALSIGTPITFDYGWTFASLLFGFAGCEIGLALLHMRFIHCTKAVKNIRYSLKWKLYVKLFDSPPYLDIALSSLFVALGVCAMHFTGMRSMGYRGYTLWKYGVITGSSALAYGVSFAGLLLATSFRYSSTYPLPVSMVIAAAVCGMHYTGMAAAQYHEMPDMVAVNLSGIPLERVELIVAIIALISSSIFATVLRKLILEDSQMQAAELMRQEHQQYFRMISEYVPEAILKRMVNGEFNVVEEINDVCVMFCDIVGFTAMCMSDELSMVRNMIMLFGAMDVRLQYHGVLKIKTVGDCYMCATNCPLKDPNPMSRLLQFAIEALGVTAKVGHEVEEDLHLRVGINTGRVISGVVGCNKAIYDIWGTTVNLASRMESSGVKGGIQISESSYKQLRIEDSDSSLSRHPWSEQSVHAKGVGNVTSYIWVPDEDFLQRTSESITLDVDSLHWVNNLRAAQVLSSKNLILSPSREISHTSSVAPIILDF